MGHGKSWKMSENDCSEDNKARNTSNENNFSILGHGKHQKSPGKLHGKSWNFIRKKEYKPCFCMQLTQISVNRVSNNSAQSDLSLPV